MAEDFVPSPHPLTPPRSDEDWLWWLRLLRSRGVGARTFHRLVCEHGSARAAVCALPELARAAGVRDYAPCSAAEAEAELERGRRAGARPVTFGSPAYPPLLALLPDAPPMFWALGEVTMAHRPTVAVVGARNASSLGLRMARRLAAGLGEAGHVVVSGLARGIDGAAHRAALPHGTIAVMPGGVDVPYPPENAALAREIAAQGLCLSECPPGARPLARHFPARNRIISGLARAVIVVEAAARSGSLLTARDALDQGREVLAVPGHPFDARAAGCNLLIRDGATLVRGPEDVIELLGRPASAGRTGAAPQCPLPATATGTAAGTGTATETASRTDAHASGAPATGASAPGAGCDPSATAARLARTLGAPAAPPLTTVAARSLAGERPPHPPARPRRAGALEGIGALHRAILDRLGPSPVAEDQLIRDLGLPAAQVLPELVTLELEGRIARHAGGLLCRAC